MTPGGWRGPAAGVGWAVVGLVIFLAPYAQVPIWPFAYSAVALLAWGALRWGRAMSDRMALPRTAPEWAATVGLGLGLGALFLLWVVPTLADAQRLGLLPWPRHVQAQLLFQAWNEEIVLGALFLLPLVRRTKRPVLTSLAVAVVFAGLHVLLYGFGAHGRWLDPMTVATLVAVGALRNVLLLLTGHIGLAFALHAAWNVSMFAGVWYQVPGMWRLSEPQVFDAFLGQPAMVVATAVAAVLGHVALARRTLREGEGRST
ncbi:MAG: hypothetical protein R3F05_16260 [Planctomycetota bacterium]